MLKKNLYDGMIAVMKRKDKVQTAIFRMINAEIKNEEIAKKCDNLPDEDVVKILKKIQKQMQESLDAFKKVGNTERVNDIRVYLIVINTYLPKQLTLEEIKTEINKIAINTSNSGQNIGKIMKEIMPIFKSKTDGKLVKQVVENMFKNKEN
jgi:hypothetical protein